MFIRDSNRRGEKTFGDLNSFDLSNNKKSLKLTLDVTLQYKLFDELKTAISSNDAKGGYALIMDAKSGDILAMASYPTFNPNDPSRIIEKNRLIDDFYEPGSLIKPFTVAGALQLKLIEKDTELDTNPGCITLSKYKRCASLHQLGDPNIFISRNVQTPNTNAWSSQHELRPYHSGH